MPVFKRKESTYQGSEVDDTTDDYDQYETPVDDEAEAEAPALEEEEQSPEPEESNSVPTQVTHSYSFSRAKRAPAVPAPPVTPQPAAAAPKGKTNDTRVYLTAKVNKELHSRLKVHSYKVHKSIVQLLEEMIAQHIPEI